MLGDLRFALHLVVKERWYSVVAVVALALGIGVNATVFTLVNAVLIKGLPFKDSQDLYVITLQRPSGRGSDVSIADLDEWRGQTKTFVGLGAFSVDSQNLSDETSSPQQLRAGRVTANTFSLLGQPPILGRDFAPGEDRKGAENVAILGYTLWKTRYSGDPAVLGRSIRLDGRPTTIVGVMPDGMMFPTDAELWTPAAPTAKEELRSTRFLQAFGRMRSDVNRTTAQTEFNGIAARLAAAYPETNKDLTVALVQTFSERFNGGPLRVVFLTMMGAVGFVLLIACANVANLLLSRSVHRSREIALRIAIGATRWRVIRQLLVESMVLGVIGGAHRARARDDRRPALRPRGRRNGETVLDYVHLRPACVRLPGGNLRADGHPVRSRAGAAGDQDERTRGPQGRGTRQCRRCPRAMAVGNDGRLRAGADGGAARWRGIDDPQLPQGVLARSRDPDRGS